MARTNLVVKHIRSNARTVLNGTVVKAPIDNGSTGLYYGEIGLNSNVIDPTLYIPVITNTNTTEVASLSLITTLAQFKSLGWLQTYVLGTTTADPSTEVRTLKWITDTLDILAADGDNVIDSWNEIKAFLSTIPADDSYTFMSMINGKASVNHTVGLATYTTKNTIAITGNGTIVTATFANVGLEELFDVGSYITVAGVTPSGYNGIFVITGCTLTSVTWASNATGTVTGQGTITGSYIAASSKLYDDVSLKTTRVPGAAGQDYSTLYVDLTSGLTAGLWSGATWTAGSLNSNVTQGTNKAIAASLVQGFYNEYSKMFTEVSGPKIQANMDFYSIGEVTAYGLGVGGGGGGGLIEVLNTSADLSTPLSYSAIDASSPFIDDTISGKTFNSYTINAIHERVVTLESGNSGGILLNTLATGFSIVGGVISKTLTVLQTLTLNGISGATLNVGAGGTLGSAAFQSVDAFVPYDRIISPVYGGTGINNNVNYTTTLGGAILTGGSFTLSGAYATTLTVTAATSITLPTSGTVLSTDSIIDCGFY